MVTTGYITPHDSLIKNVLYGLSLYVGLLTRVLHSAHIDLGPQRKNPGLQAGLRDETEAARDSD